MSNPAQGAVGAETMTAGQVEPLAKRLHEANPGAPMISWDGLWETMRENYRAMARAALATPRTDSDEGTAGAAAWVAKRLEAARRDSEAHPEGHSNRTFYEAQAIAYENVLSLLEDEDQATPAPATPPGVPDSVRALSEAATQGEWYAESEKCDGSYGSGGDCGEGYLAYNILTDAEHPHGNPGVIAETSNSTLGVIHEESDEDGHTAWDETARANTAFIVAAVNYVRSLLDAHPAGQSTGPALCGYVECAALGKSSCEDCRDTPRRDGQSTGQGAWPEHSPQEVVRRTRCMADETRDPVVWRDCCDLILERLGKPAPDSPLTGPVGVEEDGWRIVQAVMRRLSAAKNAGGIEDPETCAQVLGAAVDAGVVMCREALAARPAAPEAQGTWSEDTDDERANALRNCAEAVAFFDQVRASSSAEQAAVGADHWNWLEAACRRAAKAAPPFSGQKD